MARKTNKQKAQELVEEVARLHSEAKTSLKKRTWARSTLSKMNKAIELDKNNANAYFFRGIAKSKSDALRGATDDYDKAIELDPNDAAKWRARGLAKRRSGRSRSAIEDYDKAIELDPENPIAYHRRGFAKSRRFDRRGAMDDYNKAIELDPEYAAAWHNRGIVKNSLGDRQGAMYDYTKATELKPTYAAAWRERGAIKFRLGRYDDAIKDLDEALGLDSSDTDAQQYRQGAEIAKLRKESGEFEQQRIKESRVRLKFELRTLQFSLFCYRVARIILFAFLFDSIIAYWSGRFVIFSNFSYIQNFFNLYSLATTLNEIFSSESTSFDYFLFIVSRVSILSIIIFPVVWGIRLLNLGIERAETLKWDIFSRANTENSIEYYQRELGNKRNDFIISYMKDWMNNNPADRLVALKRKKSATNEKSENEKLLQEIKNLLERLTESNQKED